MQDRQILGNGKSRILRAPADMPATYEEWRTQMMAGAAYVDISPNNETSGENAGISVEGTPLNKASLLTDALAAALGLANAAAATPSDALGAVRPVALGGTGASTPVSARANLEIGKVLASGLSLTPGDSLTVPGVSNYNLFLMRPSGSATPWLLWKNGNRITGNGSYSTASNMWISAMSFTISGDVLTFANYSQIAYSMTNGSAGNPTNTATVVSIVGLI